MKHMFQLAIILYKKDKQNGEREVKEFSTNIKYDSYNSNGDQE